MQLIKPVFKKIPEEIFAKQDLVKDLAGNVFIKRTGVAKLFGVSLVALATTFKSKGLRPLDRYVHGYKVYM